ncbi:MAG: hypothetical protein U1E81_06345 [Xanthobacteraceae bacterium]
MTDIQNNVPPTAFSIAREEDTCVREARDWEPCEPKCFVRHLPTQAMFEFYPVPGTPPDKPLELGDFEARLAHVCDGYPVPPAAELEILGREALLMGLHFIGMVTLLEGPDSLQ